MRPAIIMIPTERPRICAECPLLGRKPDCDVPAGSKFTHHCFLPGHEKDISGRGTTTEDKQFKFRCKRKEWTKAVCTYGGDIPISATDMKRYKMEQMQFIFEKRK